MNVKSVTAFVASGFGLGYSPVAPGTMGTLPGILLAVLFSRWGVGAQIAGAAVLALLSIPLCDVAEKHYGKKDDRRIVADEYLTFPICFIGLPATPLMLAIAFVVNRVCDIVKPPPARQLQAVKGGLGVAIDDIIACLYALALNHLAFWLLRHFQLA